MSQQKTSIWLMRHGPTLFNLQHRIQGQHHFGRFTDIIPSLIHEHFRHSGVFTVPQPDIIVTSGIKRAVDTAHELIKARNWQDHFNHKNILVDHRFRERDWGEFFGLLEDEVKIKLLTDPFYKHYILANQSFKNLDHISSLLDSHGFKSKNGETLQQVFHRVYNAILDLERKFPSKKILVVCHAGVFKALQLEEKIVALLEVIRHRQSYIPDGVQERLQVVS